MLQWLYTYVASVCSKCFICFSNVCYKCIIWMLHIFHIYIASFMCFICLQTYVANVASNVSKIVQVLLLGPTSRSRRPGREVEGARVVSVWGQEARVTFERTWAPMWRVSGHARLYGRPDASTKWQMKRTSILFAFPYFHLIPLSLISSKPYILTMSRQRLKVL
jgi:hypothetical protein